MKELTQPKQRSLSEVQIQKLTYLFNLLDFNHNGYIQQDDFVNLALNTTIIKALELGHQDMEDLVRSMEKGWMEIVGFDCDDHYRIDLQEWLDKAEAHYLKCQENIYEKYIHEIVRIVFRYYDDNDDQHLDLLEYMSLLISYRAEIGSARNSFNFIDSNQDNLISKSELTAAIRTFFVGHHDAEHGSCFLGNWKRASWRIA